MDESFFANSLVNLLVALRPLLGAVGVLLCLVGAVGELSSYSRVAGVLYTPDEANGKFYLLLPRSPRKI